MIETQEQLQSIHPSIHSLSIDLMLFVCLSFFPCCVFVCVYLSLSVCLTGDVCLSACRCLSSCLTPFSYLCFYLLLSVCLLSCCLSPSVCLSVCLSSFTCICLFFCCRLSRYVYRCLRLSCCLSPSFFLSQAYLYLSAYCHLLAFTNQVASVCLSVLYPSVAGSAYRNLFALGYRFVGVCLLIDLMHAAWIFFVLNGGYVRQETLF